MKGLVREIQEDIINDTPISKILQKTLILGKKLNISELEYLVDKELNGYKDGDELPEYRIIYGTDILGWNPYHGWQYVHIKDQEILNTIRKREISESILKVEVLSKGSAPEMELPLDIMSQLISHTTKYKLCLSSMSFKDIIGSVQNLILEKCIALENKGILGEGISFSKEEIEKASSITNIFQGSVNRSPFQIGNENIQYNIVPFDLEQVEKILLQAEKYKKDILEIKGGSRVIENFENIKREVGKQNIDLPKIEGMMKATKTILAGASGNVVASGILAMIQNLI